MASRELPTDQRGDDESVGLLGVDASRRRFLRRAATGAVAVGAGAAVFGGLAPAGAQSADNTPGSAPPGSASGSTPGTVPGSPPTTSAKDKPTIEGVDLTIGIFLSSLEIAVISLYDALLTNGKLGPSASQWARTFKMHHDDQLKKLETFTVGEAPEVGNPRLTAEYLPRIQSAGAEADLAAIGQQIEERLAATYQWAMTQIEEWQFAAVVATILPVDAQQAVAWSQVVEPDLEAWMASQFPAMVPALQTDEGRFDEAVYPVAGA